VFPKAIVGLGEQASTQQRRQGRATCASVLCGATARTNYLEDQVSLKSNDPGGRHRRRAVAIDGVNLVLVNTTSGQGRKAEAGLTLLL
jgi:hypothetical protein